MSNYYLYEIRNKLNGRIYVGVHHGILPNSYMGSGTLIQKALKKYGVSNFEKTILVSGLKKELAFYIESLVVNEEFISAKETYNIRLGGLGGWDHINFSKEETEKRIGRFRISMSLKTKEEIDKINHLKSHFGEDNFWYGKPRSGNLNPRYGCTLSDQHKDALKKGRDAYLQKDLSGIGGPKTLEGKKRISEANSRTFKLISPDGKIVVVTNLAEFSRSNCLSEDCLRSVLKGRQAKHKGWTKP